MIKQADRAARDVVWDRYLELLAEVDSPLLHLGSPVRVQLRRQVDAVLDATVVALELPAMPVFVDGANPAEGNLSESIGRRRASSGVHPAQSLLAASFIFEAALPALVGWAGEHGSSDDTARVATVLNSQLLLRMSAAARGYVDHLLGRVHSSNQLERKSVSRYLHDIAAPNVALGLQNLELWELYRNTDEERADAKIAATRSSLHDALRTVRSTSEYLRVDIGERGLRATLEYQLESVPDGITHSLDVSGPVDDLSAPYAQELFLILREAIRNAIDHGEISSLRVELRAEHDAVRGVVVDDGVGFDVPATDDPAAHSVGLDSMHERTELLAGELDVTSAPGRGTRVEVTVPLVRLAEGAS